MSDYLNSVIYMIKKKDDYDNENVYIGSTNNFKQRKWDHKNTCNNPNLKGYNYKIYKYIRENGGWDEFVINVIEAYPCSCKRELVKREDEIMCEIKSNLNNIRAKRSIKEYRIDNRDKIKEKNKEYYENNCDKINEYNKEYYENNKNKVLEHQKDYYKHNKDKVLEKNKKYRKLNEEQLAEKAKEYYKNNRDKIKEREKKYRELNKEKRSEKIKCDKCGCEIIRRSLARHKKSKKCQNFVH